MRSPNAQQQPSGAVRERPGVIAMHASKSLTRKVSSFVPIGRERMGACRRDSVTIMSAPAVETFCIEPQIVLLLRKLKAFTPLIPKAWQCLLIECNLTDRYPNIPQGLETGFRAGIIPIHVTCTPHNSSSLIQFASSFEATITREFDSRQYLGPFSCSDIEFLIGPFQSSPLSLIPKPHKSNVMCLVQKFSFPKSPSVDYASINSNIISDEYPCTWTPFKAFCTIVCQLPPGTQAMMRDITEVYQIIPLHHLQWPGTVVQLLDEDSFAVDMQTAFEIASGAGIFGHTGDGSADIFRHKGIGPLTKWVDDFVLFHILLRYLHKYNELRNKRCISIKKNGGQIHSGSWIQRDMARRLHQRI